MDKYYFLVLLCFSFTYSFPANEPDKETSVLITTTDRVQLEKPWNLQDEKKESLPPIQLRKMNVISNVTNRYAHTLISTYYANPANKAQEATFTVLIPDTAFISGFVMDIKGKQYKAYVEEKKKAEQTYDDAVSSGLGAAQVVADARDSNRFTVSMNVEPNSKVIFNLTYEHLLVRKHNKYDIVINLHPGQLVKDLTTDVYIHETKPLIYIKVPQLRSSNEVIENDNLIDNDYAMIYYEDKTSAHIHFAPNIEQQQKMVQLLNKDKSVDQGIAGQFIVEYDIKRDPTGQVLVSNDGYFVHFFSPDKLKPIPKHMVFVLDVSESMYGRKLKQLKEAMQFILDELSPKDYFNLVEFSDDALVWNLENKTDSPSYGSDNYYWRPREEEKPKKDLPLPPAFAVTEKNLNEAKKIVKDMETKGGTNFFNALITGVKIANAGIPIKDPPKPIIIFLTDGQATVIETKFKNITQMFAEGNGKYKAALFTLAFGDDADEDFLKKISLKNNGFTTHIYEAADASLQLQDFYKTISSPVLLNVKFNSSVVDKEYITKIEFDSLYKGGELVVSGKIPDVEVTSDLFKVQGFTYGGSIDFIPEIIRVKPQPVEIEKIEKLEKLWAYITIRQLLDEATSKDQKDGPEIKRALDLSLKYSFVTPLTSLVVVKPNETKFVKTGELKSIAQFTFSARASGVSAARSMFPSALYHKQSFNFLTTTRSYTTEIRRTFTTPYTQTRRTFTTPYTQTRRTFTTPYTQTRLTSTTPYTPTTMGSTIPRIPHPTYIPPNILEPEIEFNTTTTSDESITPDTVDNKITNILPWIKQYIHIDNDMEVLSINDKEYYIGNNETIVETKACQVTTFTTGKCTLLSACPVVYPKLTDIQVYQQYFCTLGYEKYAGVCCIQEERI